MSPLVRIKPPRTVAVASTNSRAADSADDRTNVARLASIGEMVTSVAHESRNFLQRILAASDMLELQLEGNSEALHDLETIQQAGAGLGHLLDSLREFAGPLKLDRQPCDLPALWRTAWSQANLAHDESVLSEQTELVPFPVHVDAFRLTQVFRNLFENSRAACSGKLRVNISFRPISHRGNPAVRIVVHDNGSGFTQEQSQHLFEAFFTTKKKGTGLGMTIAQRIIEQHGGEISLDGSGQGATFCITLPGEVAMTETLDIAIADDDPAILQDLKETLGELGHRVVVAAKTGTELIEECNRTPTQLIITDIKMPDMDGLNAAAKIYQKKALPIIIASAHSDADYIGRASESHVLAYLVKPITNPTLSTAISLVMRRFREFQGLLAQSETLRQALDDRKLIERAKGILMHRGSLSEDQAFARLEKISDERNEKLSDVARAILTAEDALKPRRSRD